MRILVAGLTTSLLALTAHTSDAQCLFSGEGQFGVAEFSLDAAPQAVEFEQQEFTNAIDEYRAGLERLKDSDIEEAPKDPRGRFKNVIKSVGRMTVLEEADGNFCNQPCTVWAQTKRVLVTAGHCVPDNARRIGVHFNLLELDDEANWIELSDYEVVTAESINDPDLDFAYIILNQNLPDYVKPLEVDTEIGVRNYHGFIVIGHPLGRELHMTVKNCSATATDPVIDGFRIRHKCATLPGMSGSPILDAETLKVVGIHVGGHQAVGAAFMNYGILMSAIDRSLRVSGKTVPGVTTPESVPEVIQTALTYAVSPNISLSLKDLTLITQAINKTLEENACLLSFVSPEGVSKIEVDVLDEASDLDPLIATPGNVKFLENIIWCGAISDRIQGCSPLHSNGRSAIVRWSAPADEEATTRIARFVLHEMGHGAGLTHVRGPDRDNLMSPVASGSTKITEQQCKSLKEFAYRSYAVIE